MPIPTKKQARNKALLQSSILSFFIQLTGLQNCSLEASYNRLIIVSTMFRVCSEAWKAWISVSRRLFLVDAVERAAKGQIFL